MIQDIDLKVATADPTELTEPLHESREPWTANRRSCGTHETKSSYSLRLLRVRCQWPRSRAAEQRDERSPLHSSRHTLVGQLLRSRDSQRHYHRGHERHR